MPTAKPGSKTKLCSKCGKRRPLDQFSPHSGRRDGLQSNCNVCRREWVYEKRQATGYLYDRWYQRCRHRAVQRLIDRHFGEYEDLLAEEMDRE